MTDIKRLLRLIVLHNFLDQDLVKFEVKGNQLMALFVCHGVKANKLLTGKIKVKKKYIVVAIQLFQLVFLCLSVVVFSVSSKTANGIGHQPAAYS